MEGYEQTVEWCGRVAGGWLFRYRIFCNLEIALHEQECFAGAAGCLVTDDGQVKDLPGPLFMDMLRTLA